jgi:hypothetical protein
MNKCQQAPVSQAGAAHQVIESTTEGRKADDRGEILTESLILAQDERWRRA